MPKKKDQQFFYSLPSFANFQQIADPDAETELNKSHNSDSHKDLNMLASEKYESGADDKLSYDIEEFKGRMTKQRISKKAVLSKQESRFSSYAYSDFAQENVVPSLQDSLKALKEKNEESDDKSDGSDVGLKKSDDDYDDSDDGREETIYFDARSNSKMIPVSEHYTNDEHENTLSNERKYTEASVAYYTPKTTPFMTPNATPGVTPIHTPGVTPKNVVEYPKMVKYGIKMEKTEGGSVSNPSINFAEQLSTPHQISKPSLQTNSRYIRGKDPSDFKFKKIDSMSVETKSQKVVEELKFVDPETKENYMNFKRMNKMQRNPALVMSNIKLDGSNNMIGSELT